MKADEVRTHLASLIVGEPKVIKLGPRDTPKAVRNYFLVIAKPDGYVIQTRQRDNDVVVTLIEEQKTEIKPHHKDGVNGYYRKNKVQDFNWPVACLNKVDDLLSRLDRIDITPKPLVGNEYKTPRRED